MENSNNESLLPSKLERYMKEFQDDMLLNEGNIHEKTLSRSSIAAKWARYSYEEERYKKEVLQKIDTLKESLMQKLYEKKKDDLINQRVSEMKIKMDVEKLMKNSSQYLKIKEELENQDDVIRFMIEAKQIISSFSFDIKNAIEILKLENI